MDTDTNKDTYGVLYEDGEEDYELCRHCVRHFKAYAVGETVEVRVDEDVFVRARISNVLDSQQKAEGDETALYEVIVGKGEKVKDVFSAVDIRRFR